MKKLLGIINILSTIITLFFFWMSFGFTKQMKPVNSHSLVGNVDKYLGLGGGIFLIVLTLLVIILAVLFLKFAKKDHDHKEFFNDGVSVPEVYTKNNFWSTRRKVQYLILVMVIIRLLTSIYSAYTINGEVSYQMIFNTDFIIIGFDIMAFYMMIFTGITIYDYINFK